MKGMKKIILIPLLLSVFLLSGCMIHFNFNGNDTSKPEIQSENTQNANTTIKNMSIYIPERFEKNENNSALYSYYDSELGESLNIYVSVRYFDTIEEEIKDIYSSVDATTEYKTYSGYDIAVTEYKDYNKSGFNLFHKTYDFFVDDKIYEVTFASPFGTFSDDEIIKTISFK